MRFLFQSFAGFCVLPVVNNKVYKSSFLSNINQALGAINQLLQALHLDWRYHIIMMDGKSSLVLVHIFSFERTYSAKNKNKNIKKLGFNESPVVIETFFLMKQRSSPSAKCDCNRDKNWFSHYQKAEMCASCHSF